jgi:hypothetical protein
VSHPGGRPRIIPAADVEPILDAIRIRPMKRRLLFLLLVTGLIVLALGGWAVRGLRWTANASFPRPLPQS